MTTAAYVNVGRWVADCPRPDCGGAEDLDLTEQVIHCQSCLLISAVIWPTEAEEIMGVLEERPVPHTRNWYPRDHPIAVRSGTPHGQTVAELVAEAREHGVG